MVPRDAVSINREATFLQIVTNTFQQVWWIIHEENAVVAMMEAGSGDIDSEYSLKEINVGVVDHA